LTTLQVSLLGQCWDISTLEHRIASSLLLQTELLQLRVVQLHSLPVLLIELLGDDYGLNLLKDGQTLLRLEMGHHRSWDAFVASVRLIR